MKQKKLHITFTAFLFYLTTFSQQTPIREIDNKLTKAYKNFENTSDMEKRWEKSAEFETKLLSKLSDSLTFNYSLDSLSKYIDIQSSPDKKIKFYSWDPLEGGNHHSMYAYAQFRSDSGKIIVQLLRDDSSSYFADSEVYEVNEFISDGIKYYLTFSWGTHGDGMQHKIVQLFKITDNKLINCRSLFANNLDLVLEYFRTATLKITFNAATNEITYNELTYFEGGRFYGGPTDKLVTLKLEKGKFIQKTLPGN